MVKVNAKYIGEEKEFKYGQSYDFTIKVVDHQIWISIRDFPYQHIGDFFDNWTMVCKVDDMDPGMGAFLSNLMDKNTPK
jgi:hypothetical protein